MLHQVVPSTQGMAALLLLLLCIAGQLQHTSALYHTSGEVLHWFSHAAVKRPDLLRWRELHERQTSTTLSVATMSQDINSPARKPRPAVLFVFGEHAREVITPEVGVWLARLLLDVNSTIYSWPELSAALERADVDADGHSTTNSTSSTSSSTARLPGNQQKVDWPAVVRGWVTSILSALEVVIVPIEAMDSRRLVEAGQLCVRKTSSNVDLNRNWPFAWRLEAASEEQYGGPQPFSEPQSRLMKHLVDHLSGRLLGYVNVHSGEWALYTPWDSKAAYGPGLPADLPDLVNKVGRLCDCKAGPAGVVSGYLAYGSSMDYLYVHKRVPYPLTVEVFGGNNIGKLEPGESNKAVDAWPTVTKSGAPTTPGADFQRRLQQQQMAAETGGTLPGFSHLGRRLLSLVHRLLQQQQHMHTDTALQQQQQQQVHRRLLQQQQWSAPGLQRKRRRHRRNKLQHTRIFPTDGPDKASTQLPLLPDFDVHGSGDQAAAGDVDHPVVPSTFSAGSNLNQLRQDIAGQLQMQGDGQHADTHLEALSSTQSLPHDDSNTVQQQQQQPRTLGAPLDPLLALREAALPPQRSCFDAFNPVTEAEYRRVVADWVVASLLMLKHMAEGPDGRRMIADVAAGTHSRGPGLGLGGDISIREHASSPYSSSLGASAGGH